MSLHDHVDARRFERFGMLAQLGRAIYQLQRGRSSEQPAGAFERHGQVKGARSNRSLNISPLLQGFHRFHYVFGRGKSRQRRRAAAPDGSRGTGSGRQLRT